MLAGAKHCIVVNNGTISLTLAAMAVGVEVIVPNYTMIATPNSVFVDVEPETLCLDIEKCDYACFCKWKSGIKAFEDLCKEKNIILILLILSRWKTHRYRWTCGKFFIFCTKNYLYRSRWSINYK